jgi:OmpA family
MRARRRIVWWDGALVASVSLVFGTSALADQELSPASTAEGCERAGEVHFAVGSSKLNSQAKQSLDGVATKLQGNTELKARIEGFADPSGKSDSNQVLSENRAAAVQNYLRHHGVDAEQVTTEGRGEVTERQEGKTASQERVAIVSTCAPTPPAAEAPVEEKPPEVAAPVEAPPPPPPPAPVEPLPSAEPVVSAKAYEPRPLSTIGIGLSAGAGVIDFTQQRARSFTDAGVTWDVHMTLGTRLPVGLDLAYIGSAQNINLNGFSTDSYLLGQGVEAALRVQYPKGLVRPYVFGGVGWRQLSIKRQNVFGTGFLDFDNQGTVPFGAGIALGYINGLMFDIHGTGRVTWDDDLLRNVLQNQGQNSHTNTWDVTARLGAEF